MGINYVKGSMESSTGVRKGAWTQEEDILLRKCVEKYGEGGWHEVPSRAGLNRCRKSCRLRWLSYLKPDINKAEFSADEFDLMIRLHKLLGNRWSLIAGRLPGRTANQVKNWWNTNMRKKVSNTKDVPSKPEPKSITKDNIIKPRPRRFRKLTTMFRGDGTRFGYDLCQPSTMALPPSNKESESLWWESLLDETEINPANNNWFGGLEVNQELINSLFVEDSAPAGGAKVQDIFEYGQSC